MINVKYHYPDHKLLKHIVKYYWLVESDKSLSEIHTMTPERYLSFVLDYSGSLRFYDKKSNIHSSTFTFAGMRSSPYNQLINGTTKLFGIAFNPGALFSVFKIPLNEFKNYILNVDDIIPNFTEKFIELFPCFYTLEKEFNSISSFLLNHLDLNKVPNSRQLNIISDFYNSSNDFIIKDYSRTLGLNQKTIERVITKFIGTTPKGFLRINRFKRGFNSLLSKKNMDLTSLSIDSGYYDQSHFISEFKNFTGLNPTSFIKKEFSFQQELSFPEE